MCECVYARVKSVCGTKFIVVYRRNNAKQFSGRCAKKDGRARLRNGRGKKKKKKQTLKRNTEEEKNGKTALSCTFF